MRLLFDTHSFMWWESEPNKLSRKAADALRDPANQLVLSVASVWEMQIKLQLGKLQSRLPLPQLIENQRRNNRLKVLPVTLAHVLALQDLPFHHKDPFDRLLIAQANVEGAVLLSHDPMFAQYPVHLLW
jgi:PIN domain nuclease of toxin-antitoxin system